MLWTSFNILLPLLAIPFIILVAKIIGYSLRFFDLIKDGQLCLFSGLLAAVTMFDILKPFLGTAHAVDWRVMLNATPTVFTSLNQQRFVLTIVGSLTLSVVIIMASLFYASAVWANLLLGHLSYSAGTSTPYSVKIFGWISITTLAITVMIVMLFRYPLDAF